jgi:two-component system, OmpR family, alkaline phosphatase synthesis response regulator PhoP
VKTDSETNRSIEPTLTRTDYDARIEDARSLLRAGDLAGAHRAVNLALRTDPLRPEAFDLLGVLDEVAGRRSRAQSRYRIALELDPAFEPARRHLHRASLPPHLRPGPLLAML